jgi:hypothetical protein
VTAEHSLAVLAPPAAGADHPGVGPWGHPGRDDQALEELLELVARWLRRPAEGGLDEGPVRRLFETTWRASSTLLHRHRGSR